MKKEDINLRFVEAVNYLLNTGIVSSKADLAGTLGIKASKFSEILNYRMNIGTDLAAILCSSYNINSNWLLMGEGDMFYAKGDSFPQRIFVSQNPDYQPIPIVDISVAAGCNGYENSDSLVIADCIDMPYYMVRKNAEYYCVRVKGDSMSPTILDSSYVIVRALDKAEWSSMADNHVYVISDRDGRAYIKRVKNRLREHGFIVCMSDNVDKANYPNFNLMEDEINSILHAEWYISAKMPNINDTYYKKVNDLEDDMDVLKGQMKQVMSLLANKR